MTLTDYRHRLQAFMRQDRQPIRAEVPAVKEGDSGSATTATIRLYDPIDSWGEWWGVSAKEFASVLDDLPESVTEIRLLINSPGGEVTEGVAILNLLRNHPARVVAVVEGLAASAASFVAAGADELHMNRNAELMVHNAWGLCVGDGDDMRAMADLLDHLADNIASVYAAKAGGTVEEWRAVMAAETWFSAEEAVEVGLADTVIEPASNDDDTAARNRFDLSIFNFAGRSNAPGPQASATPPSPAPPTGEEGGPIVDLSELREALGLAEDISDDQIVAWLTAEAKAPTPEPEPAATLPEGHVVIPEARLRDLEASATAGADAAKKLRERERAEFLDSVRAKYAPANREAWEKEYDRDPEGTRKHFATAPDILPLSQLGSGGAADLDSDEALYAELYNEEVKA